MCLKKAKEDLSITGKLIEIENELKDSEVDYVFPFEKEINDNGNVFIDKLKKIKYIFVGDNPGENEFGEKKFFVGKSGDNIKNFINDFLELKNEVDYLFLNKVFFILKRLII